MTVLVKKLANSEWGVWSLQSSLVEEAMLATAEFLQMSNVTFVGEYLMGKIVAGYGISRINTNNEHLRQVPCTAPQYGRGIALTQMGGKKRGAYVHRGEDGGLEIRDNATGLKIKQAVSILLGKYITFTGELEYQYEG